MEGMGGDRQERGVRGCVSLYVAASVCDTHRSGGTLRCITTHVPPRWPICSTAPTSNRFNCASTAWILSRNSEACMMQTEHTFTRTHARTSRTLAHKGRTVGSAGRANSGKEIVGLAVGALHFTHMQAHVIVCTQKHAHRTARMRTRKAVPIWCIGRKQVKKAGLSERRRRT
jgi:hypothetical protein